MRCAWVLVAVVTACGGVTTTAYDIPHEDVGPSDDSWPSSQGSSESGSTGSTGELTTGVGSIGNECPEGLVACSEGCVDLATDNDHCGACGFACTLNSESCAEGSCVCTVAARARFDHQPFDVVAANGSLVLRSGCQFDPDTIEDSIIVRGELSGLVDGQVVLVDPRRLEFRPSAEFSPGERIIAKSQPSLEIEAMSIPVRRMSTNIEVAEADAVLTPSQQVFGSVDTHDVALGDVDCDGDIDAITATSGGVRLQLNDGAGTFLETQLTTEPARVVLLDSLFGGSSLDLLSSDESSGTVQRWRNQPCGTFTPAGQFGTGSTRALASAWLDTGPSIDVVSGNDDGPDEVWLNDGMGSFSVTPMLPPVTQTSAIAVYEHDSDEYPDVFVMQSAPDGGGVWINDTSGRFGTLLPGAPLPAQGAIVGHLDGDSEEDVVVAVSGEEPSLVLFSLAGASPLSEVDAWDVAVGDFDGDEHPDVFLATTAGAGSEVWFGDGGGGFALGWTGPAGDDRAVAAGDLDGDGDLDVWLGRAGGSDLVLINQ
jgi:hypothetical protein